MNPVAKSKSIKYNFLNAHKLDYFQRKILVQIIKINKHFQLFISLVFNKSFLFHALSLVPILLCLDFFWISLNSFEETTCLKKLTFL